MEKLKQYKYMIFIALLVLGFAFYWYEYRPSIIKKGCHNTAQESAIKRDDFGDKKFSKDSYDTYYKWCLEENGL